jgi:hypothetical protein
MSQLPFVTDPGEAMDHLFVLGLLSGFGAGLPRGANSTAIVLDFPCRSAWLTTSTPFCGREGSGLMMEGFATLAFPYCRFFLVDWPFGMRREPVSRESFNSFNAACSAGFSGSFGAVASGAARIDPFLNHPGVLGPMIVLPPE